MPIGLPIFGSFNSGLVPKSLGGTTKFLRADATFATPPLSPQLGFTTLGQLVVDSSVTLDATYIGHHILLVTTGITVTIPNTFSSGTDAIALSNIGNGAVTLAYNGGSDGPTTMPSKSSVALFFASSDGYCRQFFYSTGSP